MAKWSDLKAAIANVIKTNGTQAITGSVLQSVLNNIVSSLGENYQFVGIATTATNPGTPDGNVFYIAGEGTYTNFSNLVIDTGQLGILKWNGTWSKQVLEIGAGGGNMILDWNTDVVTTRKQVISKLRKPGMQISYKDPDSGWINEQYTGTAVTDIEWAKDSNWVEISDKDEVNKNLTGKSNVGSVFGGQKVEADGTSQKIEFTNFKKGLTLHVVDLKIAANSYVSLYGYEKGAWKIIQRNVAVGTTINTDLVLPEEVEQYSKIGFGTGSALLTGGYGYIITDLNVEDAAKYLSNIPQINKKISNIEKGILINKWNATLKAKLGYFINISGVYLSHAYGKSYDYTDITGLKNKLFLFKNLYTTASSKVSVVFYDIDKTPLQIFTTEILNDYYDTLLLAPENSAYFGINRMMNGTIDKDVEIYTIEDITTIENVKELQQKTVLYEKNALVNLPLYVKLNGNMVNPVLWEEPQGMGKWTKSNLIPVEPGKVYYFGGQGYYETFNQNGGASGLPGNTGLTSGQPFPENVYFVKFWVQNITSKDKIKVWLSETNDGYQKFGYGLNDLILNIESNILSIMSMYFPHAGKKGLYVGDSYVVLGIPQGSAEYLRLASYESNGQNGQTITNFIQNMVNNEKNINQIKNCDICFVEGGTNDFGHGGSLFGTYYDEENTDKHLKYELQIFRKIQSEELAYNSVFKDGNFVGSGTVSITIGTENNLEGVKQSVTYTSGDTVESLIDKIVALTFDGYTLSKDKNSIYIQRVAEGMHVWGRLDKQDWKIAHSVDFSEAQEVTGYIKMVQNGSGYNEVFGLSPYQLLANNNSANSFSQRNMCAAMKSTVETIHFFKPEILVCFISQPERAQYATDTITPPYSKSENDLFNMAEISIRMEDTCKRLGIPFVDGHSIGCTMWSLDVYEHDKLHLNAYGKEILRRLIAKTLNMY